MTNQEIQSANERIAKWEGWGYYPMDYVKRNYGKEELSWHNPNGVPTGYIPDYRNSLPDLMRVVDQITNEGERGWAFTYTQNKKGWGGNEFSESFRIIARFEPWDEGNRAVHCQSSESPEEAIFRAILAYLDSLPTKAELIEAQERDSDPEQYGGILKDYNRPELGYKSEKE